MKNPALTFLTACPDRLAALKPGKRLLLALLAGAMSCFALPPYGLVPLLALGFTLLLLLLQGAHRPRHAFMLGWCFAFGYFVPGLYWIAASMLVDFARFFWLIPFSVAGLPAFLALYYGLAALLWYRGRANTLGSALRLGLLFTAAEYLRGHLLSGFPWHLFGYAWTDVLPMAQSVSLFGSYGLTLLTLLVAPLPATLLLRTPGARHANSAAALGLLLLAAWGAWRLQEPVPMRPDAYIRLVQPNIAQSMKWAPEERERNLQQLLALSAQPATKPLTHIIWPESAVPFFLAEDASRRSQIMATLPEGVSLLTGSDRRAPNYSTGRWDYFNSLLTLNKSGDVIASYDKVHLVPFGEYVPFQSFGPIASATSNFGSFHAGAAPVTLHVPGLPPFSPLICYEVIFPGDVSDPARPPQLLVNITNDAWYGQTVGPYQHLAIARMRAIEAGVPLLRAANTGISAVIDPYGRVLQHLPLDQAGAIDSAIPTAATSLTYYARYNDLCAILLWFIILFGQFFAATRRRKQQDQWP